MNEDENVKNEHINVVAGDGTEIKISPVYDHIILDKPEKKNKNKNQQIVIPKEKKSNNNNNDDIK